MVDFTLRFDNLGNQAVGNVTIMDNLVTRLEYVEGSAQSSVPASFSTQRNEAESLVLRWEITNPVFPPDDPEQRKPTGGVLRFQCRVR